MTEWDGSPCMQDDTGLTRISSLSKAVQSFRVSFFQALSIVSIALASFVILVSASQTSGSLAQGAVHAGDRAALVTLYNATDGPNWEVNRNWGRNTPLGTWHGVTTDSEGRVTKLDLLRNGLTGQLPPELGNLENLRYLRLADNQLSGEIPPVLGSFSNLTHLFLDWNQLTDEIPPELGNLSALEELVMGSNQLTGEIPPELGNLSALEKLVMRYNQLSGEIPPVLGSLSNLTHLFLDWNQLTGEIPPELSNLSPLEELVMGHNQLSGEIPPVLGSLSNLTYLFLDWNQLTGEIPPELGSLSNLTYLELSHNQLNGEIPPELGSLSNLTHLRLNHNQLYGEISPKLGNLRQLERMWLGSNQLTGEIPPDLSKLQNLNNLGLSYNHLTGEIPPELGNLQNLEHLWLSSNQMSGEIPPELGNLTKLDGLGLRYNQLTGEIPTELGNLQNLRQLYLSSNPLSGGLPSELGNLQNLKAMDLASTQLTGEIPPELGNLSKLERLLLNYNMLSGGLPPELGNLTKLRQLELRDNQLSGEIPPELGNLQNLTELNLSSNQLAGGIPPELGGLFKLTRLELENNTLNGCLPWLLDRNPNLRIYHDGLPPCPNLNVREGGTISIPIPFLFYDIDYDGRVRTVAAVHGALNGTVWLDGTIVTYQHDGSETTSGGFTYTITDGNTQGTASVILDVTPVNDPPVAAEDRAAVYEGGKLLLDASELLTNDSDPDTETLSVVQVRDPVNGTVNLDGTIITYQHDGSETTSGGFTYTITDGNTQGTASVILDVTPVNDPPVAAEDRAAVYEGGKLLLDASELLTNDSDPDTETLSVVQVRDPVNGTVNLDGTIITYQHDGSETTSGGFTYTITDGNTQGTASVILDVTPVNDPPVAAEDRAAVYEGGKLLLDASELLTNDSDPDTETLSVVQVRDPVNGTVNLDGTIITYQHDGSETTSGGFTYTITDGNTQGTASVILDVTPVNDPPVAAEDRAAVYEGGKLLLDASELLTNDSDPDTETLSVVQVRDPVNGTVNLDGTIITYQHDGSETTSGGFTYTITDGNTQGTASVILDVTPVNDPPVAAEDRAAVYEGGKLLLDASELLTNDSDPDTETLSVVQVRDPVNGTVNLDGTIITYQHDGSETTSGGFTYTITDGNTQGTASVILDVTPVNDPLPRFAIGLMIGAVILLFGVLGVVLLIKARRSREIS